MAITIDDSINDPDVFLQKALNAKVEALSARINDLVVSGKNKVELERLLQTRADFMEVIRSPRLYLARPAGAAAPPAAAPTPSATAATAPATGSSRLGAGLPLGAIPQPRRLGAAEPAAPAAPAASHAAPAVPSAPSAKPGGMLSFLKGVQGQSSPAASAAPAAAPSSAPLPSGASPTPTSAAPAPTAASPPPARMPTPSSPAPAAPATSAPPAGKPGGMLSFLKSVQGQNADAGTPPPAPSPMPVPAATPPPATTPAAAASGTQAGEPPSKGQMLSFLEKVKTASGTPATAAAPTTAPRSKELTYESKKALIEMIKQRAASTGFQDIYEMLNYKKEKLEEHRSNLLKTSTLPPAQVTALIDREIAEIDALLMKRPQEILPQVQEFDEVAQVDTGGLAAIRRELKGLLDEIK